jgi:hypothetical protein
MKLCLRLLTLATFLIGLAGQALADTDGWNVDVNDVYFGTVTQADFQTGWKYKNQHIITWKAPRPWKVTIKSVSPNLGQSNDGSYTKPIADLQFKLSNLSSWTTTTTQDQILSRGARGQGTFYTDFRAKLRWAYDRPGDYGCTLQFTISKDS